MKLSQVVMPFCENWARLMSRRSPSERLRFFDTYLKTCFEGWTPGEDAGAEYDDYWIIQPMVEERVRKSSAGRAGGRPKGRKNASKAPSEPVDEDENDTETEFLKPSKTDDSSFTNPEKGFFEVSKTPISAFPSALKHEKTTSQTPKSTRKAENQSFRKEKNRNEYKKSVEKAHTPELSPEATDEERRNVPSVEDVRIAGHNLGIPADFAEYFHAEMQKLGWMARATTGQMFAVTRLNLASLLRGWWQTEQKNAAPRVGGQPSACGVPVTGAGRAAVPAWTGDDGEGVEQ